MAKAKMTESGNVKVTMRPFQYMAIMAVMNHVRLGDRNAATSAISDLLIDLEGFESEYGLDGDEVRVFFTRERKDGSMKEYDDITIELSTFCEDDDDDE